MSTLYIVGTGGFAKEVAQLADACNRQSGQWSAIAYLSADPAEVGAELPFGRVAGTDALLDTLTEPADVAIGIGMPALRRKIAQRLRAHPHLRFPTLVHPRAVFDPAQVRHGIGNLVTAGAMFTCDIHIGDFNVFNLNSTVGHDAVIGSWSVFNPGCNVSGNVKVGDACLCGTGSQIIEKITLAPHCVLGAGAVLVKDVLQEGLVLVGAPARPLSKAGHPA